MDFIKDEELVLLKEILDDTNKDVIPGFKKESITLIQGNKSKQIDMYYLKENSGEKECLYIGVRRFFDTFILHFNLVKEGDIIILREYEGIPRKNIVREINNISDKIKKIEEEENNRKQKVKNVYLKQLEEL